MESNFRLNSDFQDALSRELETTTTLHRNTNIEFVLVTTDKIRLCLIKFEDAIKSKIDYSAIGILVALASTLIVSDFHSVGPLDAQILEAFYMLATIAMVLIILRMLLKHFSKKGLKTIDDVIKELTPNVEYVDTHSIVSQGFSTTGHHMHFYNQKRRQE